MSILEDKFSFSIASHDQTKECLFIWEEHIFTSLNKQQMEDLIQELTELKDKMI